MDFTEKLDSKLGKGGASAPPMSDDESPAEDAEESYESDPATEAAAANLQDALNAGTAAEVAEAFKKMMAVCG